MSIDSARPFTLKDRVLATALVKWERLESEHAPDFTADLLAQRATGDIERSVLVRARVSKEASRLGDALARVRRILGLVILAGVVAGGIAGVAAARAALGVSIQQPVNFFMVLLALLGVQTAALVIWLILIATGARNRAGSAAGIVGHLLGRLALWLVHKLHRDAHNAAAVAAFTSVHFTGRIGAWTFSSISHAVWSAFNIGCLAALIVLLSARQYTFAWETTILSDKWYEPMTQALATLPRKAGFEAPTEQEVIDSRWTGVHSPEQAQRMAASSTAWSSLLVGSIVIYGFGPRVLLLGLSLGMRRRAASKFRLNLEQPEFFRLIRAIAPPSLSDPQPQALSIPEQRETAQRTHHPTRPIGPPAILGYEIIAPSGSPWPAPVHGVRWVDLGFVDTRQDQQRIIGELRSLSHEPQATVVVCSLTTTPDRGVRAFLSELRDSVAQPMAIVLTGGQKLRARNDNGSLDRRIQDWRGLAGSLGIQQHRIIELDLDHLTQASSSKLAALIESESPSAQPASRQRVQPALNLISRKAHSWFETHTAPAVAEQAELLREIAQLYQEVGEHGSRLFAASAAIAQQVKDVAHGKVSFEHVKDSMKRSSQAVIDRLPSRLRLNPRWVAAGAAAGALGCIAVGTLVTPIAIASLPMWSAMGAGLGAALQWLGPSKDRSQSALATDEDGMQITQAISEAIASAAMFTILLDSQGMDEDQITRRLDRTFSEAEPPQFQSYKDAERWLNLVQDRAAGSMESPSRA